MDGEAIKRIAELATQAESRDLNGVPYVKGDYRPLGIVHDELVKFSTLEDFCLFVKDNPQKQDMENAIVVVNPNFSVSLMSRVNPYDGQRSVLAYVQMREIEGFRFGMPYDVDAFIVALKSKFDPNESDWPQVFSLVKNVQVEDKMELNDDGMSQKVTVKKGVSAASITTENRPIDYVLRPYRIFSEVRQPKSTFFLRLSGDKECGIRISLHETDGGAWKNDAARAIRDYVKEHLGDSEIPVYC